MANVAAAGLAFRQHPDSHQGANLPPRQVPLALRAFWADGLFSAAQDAFILAYLPLLASALGASATQIGLLAASQAFGSMLALYPGVIAARRTTSRRWIVVFYAGILGRLTLLLAALGVAFLSGQTALYVVIIFFTVRAFLGSFTLPAWTSLAADIIPEQLRARYFASRNFAISGATLAFTPLGGILLDMWGFPGGFVSAFSVAFAFGMLSTIAYARIPEPRPRPIPRVQAASIGPRAILRNKNFRTFVLATFALHFTTMIAGPFFNVYLKENIGASNFEVGALTTASALSGLAAQLIFGDMLSRRGPLAVTRISLLVLPFLPWMWLFVSSPWMVLAPNLIGGAMWAAFGLANFQHLLEITEEHDREAYVAMFHMSMFLALFLGPLVGGLVIDYVGYKPAFFLSGAGRFISTAMFFFVVIVPSSREHEKRRTTSPTTAV